VVSGLNSETPDNFFPDDFEVETSALSSEECSAAGPIVLPLHWVFSEGRLQRLALPASMLLLALLVVLSLIFTQAASTPAMLSGPRSGSTALLKVNAALLPLRCSGRSGQPRQVR
jgi:hypothetical protein